MEDQKTLQRQPQVATSDVVCDCPACDGATHARARKNSDQPDRRTKCKTCGGTGQITKTWPMHGLRWVNCPTCSHTDKNQAS